jgi:hypothetical protein
MLREFLIKVDVPEWATHYSIDADGAVYYYEEKPEPGPRAARRVDEDEDEDDTMWIAKGRIEFSGIILESNLFGDWRETLREIR